ncbi:MAG: D-aminoacyl-tRNA deacylase [Actinomycetota bacterium]|nr:D-aminoacyl-tRNA deacylase [Actinomycetota bacterium]
MRAVVQRVATARVVVEGDVVGEIGRGLAVLVGVSVDDTESDAAWMVDKLAHLRVFSDDEGKMNRSVLDEDGAVLVVSQFTLLGDARKGRRPSFVKAAAGAEAKALYESVAAGLQGLGLTVATGEFGASMEVELTNDGPVTLLLDSTKAF